MTETDRVRLEALARAATPGPWKWHTANSMRSLHRDVPGIRQGIAEGFRARDGVNDIDISEANMAFIAACDPQTIIALLADSATLARTKEEIEKRIKHYFEQEISTAIDCECNPKRITQIVLELLTETAK